MRKNIFSFVKGQKYTRSNYVMLNCSKTRLQIAIWGRHASGRWRRSYATVKPSGPSPNPDVMRSRPVNWACDKTICPTSRLCSVQYCWTVYILDAYRMTRHCIVAHTASAIFKLGLTQPPTLSEMGNE